MADERDGRPVLMVKLPLRGARGGSFYLRWAYGHALAEGREVDFADFDRSDRAMARWFRRTATPEEFYGQAMTSGRWETCIDPTGPGEGEVRAGLTRCVNGVAETGRSLIVDTTGGDRAFLEYADRFSLSELCDAAGIALLAVAMVGPGEQDISGVMGLIESERFSAAHLVLVCNEGLLQEGQEAEDVFAPFLDPKRLDGRVARLVEGGARVVTLPVYDHALAVEAAKLDVFAAADPRRPALGMAQAFATKVWLWGTKNRPGMVEFMRPVLGRLP